MKKLQTISKGVQRKLLEAAIFFTAVLTPSSAFAQLGGDKLNDVKPEGTASSLFEAGGVFQTVANILLLLLGAIAVIMLIIGGFRYVVSGGDSSAVEGAKNTILYAIIGIIVAFLSWAAVDFVIDQLQ
ncbi:MAG: hypothetical protein WD467_02000 [Candidatus Saccharimonadales bacterium]